MRNFLLKIWNGIKRIPKTFWVICGFVTFFYTACMGQSLTIYYRLTVEINTPEGVKTGSGIRWFTYSEHIKTPLDGLAHHISNLSNSSGQEIFVDLGEKGKVYLDARYMRDNNAGIFRATVLNDPDNLGNGIGSVFDTLPPIPYNQKFYLGRKTYPHLTLGRYEDKKSYYAEAMYSDNPVADYLYRKKICKKIGNQYSENSFLVQGTCFMPENNFPQKLGEGYSLKSVYVERIEKPENFDVIKNQ